MHTDTSEEQSNLCNKQPHEEPEYGTLHEQLSRGGLPSCGT